MFNHQPNDYICPFCQLLGGTESEHNKKQDIVFKNEHTTALISPKWWVNNPGHALVIPNKRYENIYDIPDDLIGEVYKTTKKLAVAIRSTYDCDGTSIRQHNEPAGHQDVWHFHVHVYPRYIDDKLYQNHDKKSFVEADKRLTYAKKLREFLETAN